MSTAARVVQGSFVWGGVRVWQRNVDAFLRSWKVEVGGIAVEPFILLIALGFGLGMYVQELEGRSYAEFIAPGIIVSYAMFHSTFDSTYGAYLRMETHHIYDAFLFTPIQPRDIVTGEVMWGATRGLTSAAFVLLTAFIFGLVESPLALLSLPVAYLVGMMFAAIAMCLTATATTIGAMNNFFTLFIMPMFWLSGIFFPLENLPGVVQTISQAMPLTPAVLIVRDLMAGEVNMAMVFRLAEMLAYLGVFLWLAAFLMHRRLIK